MKMPAAAWVGALPEGLAGFRAVETAVEAREDAVVVLSPAPPLRTLRAQLDQWQARDTVVVVVHHGPLDPFALRGWTEAGAYCLDTSGLDGASLHEAIERVWRHHEPSQVARHRRGLGLLREVQLTFRTFDEAEAVAAMIAQLLPTPSRRIAGLLELLLNAVEHGNLGLSAADKQLLLMSGAWRGEVERRLSSAPWKERVVQVVVEREPDGWKLIVEDQGTGFDPKTQQSRQGELRGRGMMVARGAFDSIEWEGRGNRVVARVKS